MLLHCPGKVFQLLSVSNPKVFYSCLYLFHSCIFLVDMFLLLCTGSICNSQIVLGEMLLN